MILGRTGFIYVNPAVQLDLIAWRAFMLARLPSPIAIYSKTVSWICGRDRLKRARTCCLLNLLLLMYICAGQIIDAVQVGNTVYFDQLMVFYKSGEFTRNVRETS